ncbi:MAG: hypothetical protein MK211_01285 [Flavobacteriales bacterium]|jgi:membrane-associated HD superfamily phosphohydrolase|uniref:hypothetical protein n=1 Tax=Candidatus Ulvibacter alkanivorans TaxID=2267620 RepID=UPI000DF4C88D|nr:hypothetical protein [Candidatus Ulvibacter alkanivorans]MCH2488756.1 hypothetical protein [Flavobacteriales bacterium]
MDNLDLLKEKWQSREQEFPKLTFDDIYKMLLRKSSSIVKWIFYISIAELVLWTILAFFIPESNKQITQEMGLKNIFLIVNIVNYTVFAIFIYFFYVNYRSIKVTDTVKELMKNILKTRKTVKYFVIYNVGGAALLMLAINIYFFLNKEQLYETFKGIEGYGNIPAENFTSVFFLSQAIAGVILVLLLLLFYRLVYGILLRRLKRNYRELKKIEL